MGIARMNYLHERYRRAGKISDEDMLYTLSLFTLEPARWTNRYEWRELTEMELCALGTFWKDLGDAMDIPYEILPSYCSGWTDGLHWMEELQGWSLQYESEKMLPSESSQRMAEGTIRIIMSIVPVILQPVAKRFISTLLEPRLQTAMKMDEPHELYTTILTAIFTLRKLVIRYLAPPRPYAMRVRFIEDNPEQLTGNYHSIRWVAHPWYIKPDIKSRWGYDGLLTRLLGGKLPGDDGGAYCPKGYRIEDIGPLKFQGQGRDEMERTRVKLNEMNRGGCPFKFGR